MLSVQRKFVLCFAIIAVLTSPFLIGSVQDNRVEDIGFAFTRVSGGSRSPVYSYISEQGPVLNIVVLPAESDTWQVSGNTLRMKLENYNTLISTIFAGTRQLEQDVLLKADEHPILEVSLDKLKGPFKILVLPDRYQIHWLTPGLSGKRIAIDPGHGGIDSGALGRSLGLREKDVTLAVSLELKTLLEKAGAEVFMTRETDTLVDASVKYGEHIRPDLWKRRDIVQEYQPDFFLSIHNNSHTTRTAHGLETYYNPSSHNVYASRLAAQLVHRQLLEELGRRDRGLKPKNDAVLQVNDFPAILLELLFISNHEEERILSSPDFAARAAKAIYLGIADYFGETGGE